MARPMVGGVGEKRAKAVAYLSANERLMMERLAQEVGCTFSEAVRLAALQVAEQLLKRGHVRDWIAQRVREGKL